MDVYRNTLIVFLLPFFCASKVTWNSTIKNHTVYKPVSSSDATLPPSVIKVTNTNDNGLGSLRFAIANAMPGDTIRFDASINGDTIKLTAGQILLNKNLTILGNNRDSTIIDGQQNGRIFEIAAGDTIYLDNLTIQNGNKSDDGGGAIFNLGDLTLDKTNLLHNFATFGGGVFNDGSAHFTNSTLSGNNATNGPGGGVYNFRTIFFTNTTLSENTANNGGGGGMINFNKAYFTNTIISGNTATKGGGVFNSSGGTAIFINNILARNKSITLGPNIFNDSGLISPYSMNNLIGDGAGQSLMISGKNGNLVGNSTAPIDPFFKMDVPILTPSTGGNLRLMARSAAINAGDTTGISTMIPAVDLGGLQRYVGKIDMGAFEYQGIKIPPITLVTHTSDDGYGSFRFAVAIARAGDTIRFDSAIDGDTIKLTSEQILINKNLSIQGNGRGSTIIDGQAHGRILEIAAGDTIAIDGVTIQNGSQPFGIGGGILNRGIIMVTNASLSGNTSRFGGGIYNLGTTYLTNAFLSGNSATSTGGSVFNIGITHFTKCILAGTFGGFGGGVYNFPFGYIYLINTILLGNFAIRGGAVYNSSLAHITNTTLSGNSATMGGGMYNTSLAYFTNSILAKNKSIDSGPDLFNDRGWISPASNHNLIGDGAGQIALINGINGNLVGNITSPIDPLFFIDVPSWTPSTEGDLRVMCKSSAIGAGKPDTSGLNIGKVDLAGMPRIIGASIDIGAYEAGPECQFLDSVLIKGPALVCEGTMPVQYVQNVEYATGYQWAYDGMGSLKGSDDPTVVILDLNHDTIGGNLIVQAFNQRDTVRDTLIVVIAAPSVCAISECTQENLNASKLLMDMNVLPHELRAIVSVTSDGTVKDGSTYSFYAGESIYLNRDFEVETGGNFTVIIEACVMTIEAFSDKLRIDNDQSMPEELMRQFKSLLSKN